MKIALVQTNPTIGDFKANSEKVLFWLERAREKHCSLAVFPELTLCGYPPQDLLERPAFLIAHDQALEHLVQGVTGISCVVGGLEQRSGRGKPLYNSAFFIEDKTIKAKARKQLLPTYDVFDESRYFEPGRESTAIAMQGLRLGLSVCEDIWFDAGSYPLDPLQTMAAADTGQAIDLLINISASPYHHGKLQQRRRIFSDLCKKNNIALCYVNQVAGQDALIFDGHSLLINTKGDIVSVAPGFVEDMLVVDSDSWDDKKSIRYPEDSAEMVLEALCLGVRDYLHKSGFTKALLGLSGGIDSAVTAAIACRALGPENVLTVALPSPYTAQASIDDARSLAQNFGCAFEIIPINTAMDAYQQSLAPLFTGLAEDVTEQNIQARIRGNLLMALSNKFGHLLLSTGNKSEMAVGYCTLYGDMSGGLAVLADVPKAMVYELAGVFNKGKEMIPQRIITRPPTAELKPDQCDQDDLPPYEELDPILTAYLEENLSIDQIVKKGHSRKVVADVVRRITVNEYKRKQAPLGLKVTSKAFGHGRRYPVVQNFRE